MLVFMRFKIGMDLGIVLAKGVLCSLLCVFTVLPGLILWADKLVRKTTKKPRAPKRERRSVLAALGRFSYRWRGAIAAAFVLLFAGTYILQLSTQIAYTLTDADPVAEVFPPDNPIVVLYNNADEDAVAAWRTGSRPTRTSRAPWPTPPRSAGSTPPRRWSMSSARSTPASRSAPICWA